jgi:hypothetical protein
MYSALVFIYTETIRIDLIRVRRFAKLIVT